MKLYVKVVSPVNESELQYNAIHTTTP